MKALKNTLKVIAIAIVVVVGLLYITDTDYLLKAVRTIYFRGHTTAYLEDYKHFDNQVISASDAPKAWPNHADYNTVSATARLSKAHKDWGSIAYVIIKNDSVWHEQYFDDFSATSKSNSFSMAKSYVSGLMQIAIQQGHIKSLDQPVCDFLPAFCDGQAKRMTVGDLSSMAFFR